MFENRLAAGEMLAEKLAACNYGDCRVLAIPRGGIVVAAPVARRLKVRLEVLVTRKIGHPANPEVAIGAVMADGSAVIDEKLVQASLVSQEYLKRAIAEEYAELQRRLVLYSSPAETRPFTGSTVIVVDDGIATGYTVRAALSWLRTCAPAKTVVAVPVAPPETVIELQKNADEVICLLQPPEFMAVGQYYRNFPQNTDAEVLAILRDVNGQADGNRQ